MRFSPTFGALGLLFISLPLTLSACTVKASSEEPVSQSDALEAVDEATLSSQASSLTSASIELSTNFTIGRAVENAASELRTFVLTQLPCADAVLDGNKLNVTYGAKPGNCVYRGHTFSGRTQVQVTHNDAGDVVVDHTWMDFSNGVVKVNGTAEVTWTSADPSRRVVHHLVWSRLSDGRTGTGTGDRTDTPLHGDITIGVLDHGHYTWDGARGHWDLSVQGLEARWADPAPQAGSLVLTTPKDQTVTMSFARVDADSIRVTVTSAGKRFSFVVNRVGISQG